MNHFSRPVFMRVRHPVRILNKLARPGIETCNVAGPICTPVDVIGPDVLLPAPEAGDLVGVFHAGAYGYTMSILNFMSMGLPAELMVDNGCLEVIRPARPASDLFPEQRVPGV
jgi:diaminopimelate decarboxylase